VIQENIYIISNYTDVIKIALEILHKHKIIRREKVKNGISKVG